MKTVLRRMVTVVIIPLVADWFHLDPLYKVARLLAELGGRIGPG